ncbi:MAG: hypothetical protein KJ811_04040 [Candidatus Margulisbacteria bacterium]|nr:hypothetical protein [Candidatus Margulisiibacteriota bacterium]
MKVTKYFLFFLCFILLFGCSAKPAKNNILRSMAQLDQVYIPALMFAKLHKQKETKLALSRLRREWNNFHLKNYNLKIKYGVNIVDKFWQEDFDEISGLIVSAEQAAELNDLDQIYVSLEKIRLVLLGIRSRNGLSYFLDPLNQFDQTLDKLKLELQGKDRLGDKDLKKLNVLREEAQRYLTVAASFEIGPELFGFKPEKVSLINQRILQEQQALDTFEKALSSLDHDDVFQAAQELTPNFIVLYKAFGDFQPVFDAIIKERKHEEKNKQLAKTKSK